MAELTNAMKGVIKSSTARTSSTYASTDLIQLYDSNNAPTIKISKDDLMAAVKASLPSLLSDQGTSGTSFPSIASGVLGSITAANLASVLGGLQYKGTVYDDMDDIGAQGLYYVSGNTHLPSDFGNGMLVVLKAMKGRTLQIITRTADSQMYWRMTWEDYSQQGYPVKWYEWNRVTTDMPSFYKDYNSLTELKAALDAL